MALFRDFIFKFFKFLTSENQQRQTTNFLGLEIPETSGLINLWFPSCAKMPPATLVFLDILYISVITIVLSTDVAMNFEPKGLSSFNKVGCDI